MIWYLSLLENPIKDTTRGINAVRRTEEMTFLTDDLMLKPEMYGASHLW